MRGTQRPDQSKLEAVKDFKQPETKKDVRAFLGLTGYYRTFILGCASRAAALTDLTRKREPSNLTWTPECTAAFQDLKDALCSQPVLSNPDLKRPFVLQVDASDVGLGAVMSQVGDDREEHPVAYASRKLFPRELKYATIEKEDLALKWAVQEFRVYLLGREFTVMSDHQPLHAVDEGQHAQCTSVEVVVVTTAILIRGEASRWQV